MTQDTDSNAVHHHQTFASRDACPQCVAAMKAAKAASESLVGLTIDLTVSAAEMSTWTPSRIEQFFTGIAKAVSAKASLND
jgi:uncharacterized protein (UPF0212 family)